MEQIIDMYGRTIEVTNLPAAIRQAEAFAGFEIEGEEWKAFNEERKTYWTDVLQKLRLLLPDGSESVNGQ